MRACENAARFATIIAVGRGSPVVAAADIAWAIALARHSVEAACGGVAKYMRQYFEFPKLCDRVLEYIKASPSGFASRYKIERAFRGNLRNGFELATSSLSSNANAASNPSPCGRLSWASGRRLRGVYMCIHHHTTHTPPQESPKSWLSFSRNPVFMAVRTGNSPYKHPGTMGKSGSGAKNSAKKFAKLCMGLAEFWHPDRKMSFKPMRIGK